MVPETPLLWTSEAAATATGGRATADWHASGVSIDSRTIEPGDLFVAIRGPSFDGHAFVAQALAKGAAAAMVDSMPGDVEGNAPLLVVKDTFAGLEALGGAARSRTRARVVGVTGSVGKTGTKEALAHCLGQQGTTFATAGSFNNHWGVPLSLSRLPADAEYGVFELGMNHAGELKLLSRQVRPHVAVITTIEPAHLEFFSSVEAIADAKAEIFDGMDHSGVAVLNRDNPQFGRLANAAKAHGLARVWSFGANDHADARILDCSLHATCSAVTAAIRGERIQYCLSLPGRHWVMNSLGVLLAAVALGADLSAAARSLSSLKPVKGRGVRRRIHTADGAFTLIDESYNASPAAMRAAFEVLGKLDPGAGGRRVAVLGDMRELGVHAPRLHADLFPPLKAAGVDTVFCCGEHMRALFDILPATMRGHWAETSGDLLPIVLDAVHPGDVVLVKGSAGSKMGPVVAALTALDRGSASGPAVMASGQRG